MSINLNLSSEMFKPVDQDRRDAEIIARPSTTYWQDVWRRLKANKVAMGSLCLIGFLVIMALVGPYLNGFSYSDQALELKNLPPNSQYWFGSDSLGRDLFTRVWFGARMSLAVGFTIAFVVLIIGVIYGGISGLAGGWVDEIMMRIVEILSGIPFVLYVILIMVILNDNNFFTILFALSIIYWIPMARLVRGQILWLKEQEYVLAARTLGASPLRILLKHLIPNTMGPILVYMTMAIPEAIFTEAWLSFLGLGVSAPFASWGTLASDGVKGLRSYPWQLLFPAVFISLTILAFNLFGDGLRDALDPRTRK
ncbi:ABC transporter permease [Zhaonella formicivorans]|uniref:ABC transporter permease n=1 Tax=Zhaonella formicivorans TaxID=2528593 RepID=UPI001D11AB07|nr:ABC transporter permease [Zhaonella formicivorans]